MLFGPIIEVADFKIGPLLQSEKMIVENKTSFKNNTYVYVKNQVSFARIMITKKNIINFFFSKTIFKINIKFG